MRLGPREQDNYEHIADLGRGAFGAVTLVKDRRIMDSQPMVNYAMKVVSSVICTIATAHIVQSSMLISKVASEWSSAINRSAHSIFGYPRKAFPNQFIGVDRHLQHSKRSWFMVQFH